MEDDWKPSKKRANTLQEQYRILKEKEKDLDRQIEELRSRGVTEDLRPQMNALHLYNETKDATQVVLGYLADIEQTSIAELHQRFNLPLN